MGHDRRVPAEFAFLDQLIARLPAAPPGQVWAGDDAAVLDATVARLRGPARDEAAMLARIVRHRAPR